MLTSRRRGFTLAEVVISAAILAIGAAVAAPIYAGYYNNKRAVDTSTALLSLSLSLENPNIKAGNLGFLYTILKYPARLNHLVNKITLNDSSCSLAKYVAGDTVLFNIHGFQGPPYSGLPIIKYQGVFTPMGWIHDSVVKGTSTNGTAGYVELHIDSLSTQDAQNLDIVIDGSDTPATGLVRYGTSPTNASFQLVRFLIPAPVNGTVTKGC